MLELEPNNLRAAEALIPIYTAANNAKALANAIEVKLAHEQDPPTKLELYREVAALYEGEVKDPQKAFDRYLAAFELAPGDEQARTDVERAAKVTGDWERVIGAYRAAIDAECAGDVELVNAAPPSTRARPRRRGEPNRRGARRVPRRLRGLGGRLRARSPRSSSSTARRPGSRSSSASTRRSAS